MRPIIGVTAGRAKNEYKQEIVALTEAYLEAVAQAGGLPVVVPYLVGTGDWQAVYSRLDGILFSGGGDIAPERFGAGPHPRIDGVDPARDELELGLVQEAASDGKPFLGICRGFQVVNVGLGGTLYTHIPDQVRGALKHDNPGNMRHDLIHEVKLEEGSHVGKLMTEPLLQVNSHHHQGLKDLAPGLRAVGYSPDGLVEAIELPEHPFGLAVQWHPEWLTDMEPTRRLFKGFVEAASRTEK
jgi:putative glutamine amidotransferase